MVDKYDELSCSAMAGPVGHQRGQIWDMEDLVLEGASRRMCPYYAARDLVFFADVNFCTYPYLLDPLIRHETKMEGALKNNAIVVFDEAHNVAAVCQDALSLECPRGVLTLILSELEPLVPNQVTRALEPVRSASSSAGAGQDGFATIQYPKELHLGSFTLADISFLCAFFRSISAFFDAAVVAAADNREKRGEKRHRGGEKREDDERSAVAYMQGSELECHLRRDMEAHVVAYLHRTATQRQNATTAPALASLELFQRAYGVIMALGVTFNPFLFSVFGLSMLKRWLLLLRFLLQKPQSFAIALRSVRSSDEPAPIGGNTEQSLLGAFCAATAVSEARPTAGGGRAGDTTAHVAQGMIKVRCLDGSLAFSHLLQTVHRVVLASGTLSPFAQLARDLGVEASLWRTVEGLHVVPPTQHSLTALTALPGSSPSTHDGTTTQLPLVPLRCTYASLSNPTFLKAVARAVVQLTQALRESGGGGGALLFVPNYDVLTALAKLTREVLLAAQPEQQYQSSYVAAPVQLFLEPRKAEALTEVLSQFQSCTRAPRCGTALFFSVYRGKVSEGLDFTDDMARLVLCLGLPLQPLKSWKVMAQRAYSGPEWYTTDAVRAVNQALGRCLRHVKDYGAMVLLDERYAQLGYQQPLSKWCRAALQTESSLPQLCARLRASFAQWRRVFGSFAMGPTALPVPSTEADRAMCRDGAERVAQRDAAS